MSVAHRKIMEITGEDRVDFLQGLVTNDVSQGGLIYTALLSPQGKYIADFFLLIRENEILLDVDESLATGLVQRLNMYKLRADVSIAPSNLKVSNGLGDVPKDAIRDPRHDDLGWRRYHSGPATTVDLTPICVALCIPQSGIELSPETYILEAGFERLHGVDFKKGCYVGQEVTARMKHKTELRKGFATVSVSGDAPIGTDITAGGKPVGTLFSQAEGKGIAHLRFDRATGEMRAGDAVVTRL